MLRQLGRLRSGIRNGLRARGLELVQVAPRGGESLLGLHLWHLFSAAGVATVVDVGARTGEFGSWLRRNGYAGRIVSFEPVERNFRRLSQRASNDAGWTADGSTFHGRGLRRGTLRALVLRGLK